MAKLRFALEHKQEQQSKNKIELYMEFYLFLLHIRHCIDTILQETKMENDI